MKVSIIGNGNVGMATFREFQSLGCITDLTLVGRSVEKILAEITDYTDAAAIRDVRTPRMTGGGYEKIVGSDILVYTAGVPRRPGQSRLDLMKENVAIARSIFGEIKQYIANEPIIIVISNPVDILTAVIQKETNLPRNKVIGTGTLLDTARLKKCIGELLDISTQSVNVAVLGEHGDSAVPALSALRILGMSLQEYLSSDIETEAEIQIRAEKIQSVVKNTAKKLILHKGYTAYGVAAVAGKIVASIAYDSRDILPVSVVLNGEYGAENIAASVPCVLGHNGVLAIKKFQLDEEETVAMSQSLDILKTAYAEIE